MPRLPFILALVLALFLLGKSHAPLADGQYTTDQRMAKITWKAVCRLSNYRVCPRKGPEVRRSPIVGEIGGAYGLYWMGMDVVWIDTKLKGNRAWLTTFHEQIHYLQYVNTVDVGESRIFDCLIEREAMELTNDYARELKAGPSHITNLARWRQLYNCQPRAYNRGLMYHSPPQRTITPND